MISLFRLGLVSSLAALFACNNSASSSDAANGDITRVVYADEPAAPATPEQMSRVVALVPQSRPADYFVSRETLKVMAVENGDDASGRFAVVSNTANWSTKNLHVGDTFSRGFTVRTIDESGVVFADAKGSETRAAVGRETTLPRIDHRYDRAVRYEGRGKFALAANLAREALEQRGSGATFTAVDGLAEPGVRLTVSDATLASALGLRTNDIILTVDGERATVDNTGALLARTTNAGAPVVVRAYRNGSLFSWTYQPK